MRILVAYKYYWPDKTPYALILKHIVERWARDGHEISVYTGQPSYNNIASNKSPWTEKVCGVNIRRIWLFPVRKRLYSFQVFNTLIFAVRLLFHALCAKRRYNLIMINSYPPVLMALFASFVRQIDKTPFIYHCQDIQPESASMAGVLKSSFLYKLLQNIDKRSCMVAHKTITLSDDMMNTLLKRGIPRKNISVINNFIVDVADNVNSAPELFKNKRSGEYYVLFAGNIGNFQGLDAIVSAAKLLEAENQSIKFIFMGTGSALSNLKNKAGCLVGKTIYFIPYQPLDIAFAAMKRSDIGIVSLKPGVIRVAYPSKTMMYLAAGCPIFALIEADCELSNLLVEKDLGIISSRSPQDIKEKLLIAYEKRAYYSERCDEIKSIAHDLFDKSKILDQWSLLLRHLDQ